MSVNSYQVSVFPASHGQEQLWFLNELNPDSQLAYTMAIRVSIHGKLNIIQLQRAVNRVVAAQEILRTSFSYIKGEVCQVISPSVMLPVHTVESLNDDDDALQRLINMEIRRGWSLKTAPLYRLLLIKTGDERYELIICTHHIVCDGISLQLLLQQIINAYQHPQTPPDSDGEDTLQFADYAAWSKQNAHSGVDYWREQLANAPTVLNITSLTTPVKSQTFTGARIPLSFAKDEWPSLRQTAIRHGISTAALFLAAYCVVLHRLAEQTDILVGVPTSNRLRPELAQVIGYLSNICIFRSRYAENQTITQYLQHVQQTLTHLIEHGETPLQSVLHHVEHTRQTGVNPLFQVLFGYEQNVQHTLETDELQLTINDLDVGAARLDLSLFLFEDYTGNVSGFLEYAADRIDEKTAENINRMLLNVLRTFLNAPQTRLSAVSVGTGDAYLAAEPLDQVFSSVPARLFMLAETTPHAVALSDDHHDISFAQLRQRVIQAAKTLRQRGINVGDPVALMGERGIPWVTTLLAIWQTGGIAVPLDAAQPKQRLHNILATLKGCLLIADASLPTGVTHADTLAMTSLWHANEFVTEDVSSDAGTHSGYMMFTSGSTGVPKGVRVSQSNLCATLSAFGQLFKVTPRDRMLALTTFAFDISLLELLLTLVHGGSVRIAASHSPRDAAKLADYLADPRITMVQATPSGWSLLLSAGWQPRHGLTMLCGGEVLPQDTADRLCQPGTKLWNLYGPTETTIWSTAYRMRPGASIQLGRPIPGTRVTVVDSSLNCVPKGVVGELLIAGAGVSQGYSGNARETANKFVPDITQPGQRAYLTGDKVRMLSDGSLVYLGRQDDQIKLRGHRIELGDIEMALRSLPGIQDAAARLSGQSTTGCIQAFLQFSSVGDDASVDLAPLLGILRQTLPSAWLPTEFYRIDSIPLTPNGKRDKKRLGDTAVRLDTPGQCIAPRNDTETRVQRIWRDLLQREHIGVTDDFFQLGGHSILVARMVESIEADFGQRVPIADIYVAPTIARVAATLDSMKFTENTAVAEPQGNWEFSAICLQAPPHRPAPPKER
ncbi:non-ribosomal peptide synthetase [Serratia rubidaea]|uniref:non-ribosomal peptide synthetase n=1 Tax=Serratia rubidaea TaxID=61652 RepID=UPI0022B8EB44|nr:amino acid adenylation domain-containing protein [Serratia rubidaea]WBF45734.1 amino acid adenylation domain-containing protein [Serratia rubidaea]